ncbi:MAG: hypothetical protein PHS46_08445 [Candidatus Omnitrophica bacterium]|nr:hypothetical protein [Candidatus Omnitrophota bacterium]
MPSNKIIVILGRKGSGKTEYCRAMMKGLTRFIAYDPVRQFSDGVVFQRVDSLLDFLINNYHNNFKAIYQPQFNDDDIDTAQEEFVRLARIVQNLSHVYFIVDEIDIYTSAHQCPAIFKNLILRGRHKEISIITTTRRHTETSRHLTAQADIIVSFHQQEPNDIKYLSQFYGEKAASLPSLEPYHYIKYENGITTLEKPIKIS